MDHTDGNSEVDHKNDPNPELTGLGCALILPVMVSAGFLFVYIADQITVIIMYGTSRYFQDGLRLIDSKHGVLSNGDEFSAGSEVLRALLVMVPLATVLVLFVRCRWFATGYRQDQGPPPP